MDETWLRAWREIVSNVLQKRGWLLLATEELLARVVPELESQFADGDSVPVAAVERAAVRCYTRALHDACGDDSSKAQARAYRELWAYLCPRALYRLHDTAAAQDACQQTLVKIHARRATCRDASSFLRWCDQILVNEIKDHFRAQYTNTLTARGVEYVEREIRWTEWTGTDVDGESELSDETISDPAQNTQEAALQGPMRDALVAALRACLDNERHVYLMVELFINNESVLRVAQALQTTPLNVQVIKSRALKKLRECDEMQQLFAAWLD